MFTNEILSVLNYNKKVTKPLIIIIWHDDIERNKEFIKKLYLFLNADDLAGHVKYIDKDNPFVKKDDSCRIYIFERPEDLLSVETEIEDVVPLFLVDTSYLKVKSTPELYGFIKDITGILRSNRITSIAGDAYFLKTSESFSVYDAQFAAELIVELITNQKCESILKNVWAMFPKDDLSAKEKKFAELFTVTDDIDNIEKVLTSDWQKTLDDITIS